MVTKQDVVQHIAPVATQIGSVTSTGSGLWLWLGKNHDQIAACGVIFGVIVGCFGAFLQYKTYRMKKRRNDALMKFKEREAEKNGLQG